MIPPFRIGLVSLLAACALGIAGCGNKEEAAEATSEGTAATADAQAEPAEEQAASSGDESTTDTLVIQQVDVQETLSASDKAMQSKDWQAATDNLLKLQLSGSIKSDGDSWQYSRRMTVLQDQLSQAAEDGDPKAKAAIELLRKSRKVR